MERRAALEAVIAAVGGAVAVGLGVLGAVFGFSSARRRGAREQWIALCRASDVPAGEVVARSFSFRRLDGWYWQEVTRPVYVLRTETGDLRVLSRRCTHLGCEVRWVADSRTFRCPCHGAVFGDSGRVLEGPPARPLDEVAHRLAGDVVEVPAG